MLYNTVTENQKSKKIQNKDMLRNILRKLRVIIIINTNEDGFKVNKLNCCYYENSRTTSYKL